jgi:hypothetical protein
MFDAHDDPDDGIAVAYAVKTGKLIGGHSRRASMSRMD